MQKLDTSLVIVVVSNLLPPNYPQGKWEYGEATGFDGRQAERLFTKRGNGKARDVSKYISFNLFTFHSNSN